MASLRSPVNVIRPHDLRQVRERGLESNATVFIRLTLGAVLITQSRRGRPRTARSTSRTRAPRQDGSYGQGRYARLIRRYMKRS